MNRIPRPLVLTAALLAAGTLAACGSSSSSGLIDSKSPSAATSAAPTEAPTDTAAPTEAPTDTAAPAVTGAWATTNCAQLAPPTGADKAAGSEVTTGIAVEQKVPADAPLVSIAENTAPATALGSYDLIPGTGAEVAKGATVTANYCGVGLTSRSIFDSSWARGQAATFPLDQVITGWTDGLPGMKVGGTRVLVIPGSMAYGANPPQGSGIAPNETLVFVVSLTATQ